MVACVSSSESQTRHPKIPSASKSVKPGRQRNRTPTPRSRICSKALLRDRACLWAIQTRSLRVWTIERSAWLAMEFSCLDWNGTPGASSLTTVTAELSRVDQPQCGWASTGVRSTTKWSPQEDGFPMYPKYSANPANESDRACLLHSWPAESSCGPAHDRSTERPPQCPTLLAP